MAQHQQEEGTNLAMSTIQSIRFNIVERLIQTLFSELNYTMLRLSFMLANRMPLENYKSWLSSGRFP